ILAGKRVVEWLHPLANAGACTLERGFPVAVSLYSKSMTPYLGLDEWATVRRLDGVERLSDKQASALLMQPSLARLQSVGKVRSSVLPRLAQAGFRAGWRELALVCYPMAADALAVAPELRKLSLTGGLGYCSDRLPRGLLRPLTALTE